MGAVMPPGKRKRSDALEAESSPGPTKEGTADSTKGGTTPNPAKRARILKRLLKKSQMFSQQLTQKTDFTIVCEDFQIEVHSMLLSCRSCVFDAMFAGHFLESLDRHTEIKFC